MREVSLQVDIIVLYHTCNDVCRRDAWSPLTGQKPAHVFDGLVDVLSVTTAIGYVVVGNKVNLEHKWTL